MALQRFAIQNASSGRTVASVMAYDEQDALVEWLAAAGRAEDEERLVRPTVRRARPYITGDHGAYYVATPSGEIAAMREP